MAFTDKQAIVTPLNKDHCATSHWSKQFIPQNQSLNVLASGVAKVGNGWAKAQPIMSSAQPIFMSIVQPIYAPFHVKLYNKYTDNSLRIHCRRLCCLFLNSALLL